MSQTMEWIITGTNQSGEPKIIRVKADDQQAAENSAIAKGVLPESIAIVPGPDGQLPKVKTVVTPPAYEHITAAASKVRVLATFLLLLALASLGAAGYLGYLAFPHVRRWTPDEAEDLVTYLYPPATALLVAFLLLALHVTLNLLASLTTAIKDAARNTFN